MAELHCCFVSDTGVSCDARAEFSIHEQTRTDPDNETHACAAHVGKMLGATIGYPPCHYWTVSEL